METRNWLVGSVREATSTECDVGFGLRMQPAAQSFPPPQKMMMVMPHHDPYHEALLSNGGFGGGGWPMFCNTSNQEASKRDCYIYDLVAGADAGFGTSAAMVPKTLNPSNTDIFTFNSSGGGMAAYENVIVPFTAAQWQELERQAMAYKYMMASVPVPPQLFIPFTKTPSNVAHSHSNYGNGGSWELGFSNNSDPEPWRCRRTDGKKWRCSRDAVLDQKYCERHSHKNRPRSRKPVELEAQFVNNNNNANTKPYQKPHFLNHPSPRTMVSATSCEPPTPRCLEWFTKGETSPVAGAKQDYWQQMMQFNVELNNCVAHVGDGQGLQTLEGALNLNYTQQKRYFVDAWSTAEGDNIGEINNKWSKLPLSTFALSVCVENETKEESKNGEMGIGSSGSERENVGDMKSQWMNSLSWMSSPPGGPLAEALYLGTASSAKAASPCGCGSGSGTASSRSSCGDGGKAFSSIN